jgi:hypothetical protein
VEVDETASREPDRWSVVALLEPKPESTTSVATVALRDALALVRVELRARARRVILVRANIEADSRRGAENRLREAVAKVELADQFELTNVFARPAAPPRTP